MLFSFSPRNSLITSISHCILKQSSLISVKEVANDSFLKIPLECEDTKEFDFCMCNPPFFISEFEASYGIARSEKRPQPSGVCTGTETETVTGGGEVEFVKEIIKDSLFLKEQIRYCCNRPSDRVREKKENCAGFGRQIVR